LLCGKPMGAGRGGRPDDTEEVGMTATPAVRVIDDGAVRSLVLCRATEYNTITPQLRDELAGAIEEADRDHAVRVILLRAEGRACGWPASVSSGPSATCSPATRSPDRRPPGSGSCSSASPTRTCSRPPQAWPGAWLTCRSTSCRCSSCCATRPPSSTSRTPRA